MLTEDFELVSVDGIFCGFRSLHQAFSDKVIKRHLAHLVCTKDAVRSSRWCCDLLCVDSTSRSWLSSSNEFSQSSIIQITDCTFLRKAVCTLADWS